MDIRLRGIGKAYGERTVLAGVDLDVPAGGVVVLEGVNGSGKTTLVEIIAGLTTPDRGELALGGAPAASLAPYERSLFYVPQSVHRFWALQQEPFFCYLPTVSVRENLEEAALRDERKAEDFLRMFGLFAVRGLEPAKLSRGQQQRLALARAFLSRQPIILLDEPLASIDPSGRQDMIDTLVYLQRRYARTLLFVTQHPEELRHVDAPRLALREGRLAAGGRARTSLTRRLLGRALPELLTALTVDAGDRLEAAAIAGRRPSDVLEWIAGRLRAREGRAAKPAAVAESAPAAVAASVPVPVPVPASKDPFALSAARPFDKLRVNGQIASAESKGPVPLAADSKEPAPIDPRRLTRRRQAPWIDEPLAASVWRPGQPAPTAAAPLPLATSATPRRRRILILRCPSLIYNYHGIPPFGLATITAELQHHGYDIRQDDLDAKCAHAELFPRHRWGKQFPAKSMMMDVPRMRRHWETGADADVLALVEWVLSFTDLGDADTIALSCIEGDDYAAILALCIGKYLRERLGRTVIVGGEAFPHMQPIKSELAYFYQHGCLDYYIQGYGEAPLLALLGHLDAGEPVDDTPGLVSLRPDGTLRENPPLFVRPEVVPDFAGLPIELYYKKPDEWDEWKREDAGVEQILVLPFKTSFCCPNKCAFCISSGDPFTKVSWLAPQQIVDGLAELKRRYRTSYFMFADDMFNISPRWAADVADAIIAAKLDIQWSDCAFARNVTPELLAKLRASGAIRLVWGMESASPRLQTLINKNLDLDELARTLRWSHEAGIYNGLQVIAGLPTETEADIDVTIDFLRRNRDVIDQVYLNPFSLMTGSLMHKDPARWGLVNVQPVATIFQSRPDQVYSWIQRYTFDCADGMAWPDKVKQIEHSFRRLQETILDLDLGGHDIHTLMLRFARYGSKHAVKDFQSSRRHQGFDYFGDKGKSDHNQTGSRT